MAGVDEAAVWVALRATMGDVRGRALLERGGRPADAIDGAGLAAAGEEVDRIVAGGARLVTLEDAEYPALLRQLHDAPLHLTARGEPLVDGPAVAIVGARRATPYGRDVARRLAEGLAHAGVTVVSGLAR